MPEHSSPLEAGNPALLLAELVAQRLCHDLANPLGAVNNGLELLGLSAPDTPETQLMRESIGQALDRIRLFRLAFGPVSGGGDVSRQTLAEALQALGRGRRLALDLTVPPTLPRMEARLLTLMALCAESALAWGGHLAVCRDEALRLEASAPRLKIEPELWPLLSAEDSLGATSTLRAPQIQFTFLRAALREAGRKIQIVLAPQSLTMCV